MLPSLAVRYDCDFIGCYFRYILCWIRDSAGYVISHTSLLSLYIYLQHNVTTVPTVLFINSDGTVLDRIDGGEEVASVTQFYSKLVNATSTSTSGQHASPSVSQTQQNVEMKEEQSTSTKDKLNKRLQTIITSSPIVLFQKGTPTDPKCGFSRQAIELLTSANVSFGYFDILQDEEVRQGLKSYSDWPTYPQLYIRGELVGGLDILKEMAEEDGGLVDQLELGDYVIQNVGDDVVADAAAGEKGAPMEGEEEEKEKNDQASLNERLKQLITRHRIMLFMKGIPSSPRCGFSRQIVETLDGFNVSYDAFNILEDEEVRQGLKVYSDWPTFPQLYVEGDLLGGLDIVKEMEESGDLEEVLRGTAAD